MRKRKYTTKAQVVREGKQALKELYKAFPKYKNHWCVFIWKPFGSGGWCWSIETRGGYTYISIRLKGYCKTTTYQSTVWTTGPEYPQIEPWGTHQKPTVAECAKAVEENITRKAEEYNNLKRILVKGYYPHHKGRSKIVVTQGTNR